MNNLDPVRRQELQAFAQWLLDIGDGKIQTVAQEREEEPTWIKIPLKLLVEPAENPIRFIIEAIYTNFETSYLDSTYLRKRVIITPYNHTVDDINAFFLQLVLGNSRTYYSCDIAGNSSDLHTDFDALYLTEFLKSLNFLGVATHELNLKIGCLIMLLRNFNQNNGLCNETRLVVTQLANNVIEARIIIGPHSGEKVFIPIILMTDKSKKNPFHL